MADTPQQDRDLKLPRTKIGERYLTAYDPSLALQIVEKIAEGELLKEICTLKNRLPAASTFLKWVARVPELAQAYAAAKEISALSMEEEAISTARALIKAPGTTQKLRAAEILINQLRWSAQRRDPKQYGDKTDAKITVPIQINTTLDMGEGQGSSVEQPDIYTIEVNPGSDPTEGVVVDKRLGPQKRVLIPRIPMDAEVETDPEREAKRDRKREADRLRWREKHGGNSEPLS